MKKMCVALSIVIFIELESNFKLGSLDRRFLCSIFNGLCKIRNKIQGTSVSRYPFSRRQRQLKIVS